MKHEKMIIYLELSSFELSLLLFLVFDSGVGSGSETTKSDILSPLLSLEVHFTGLRFLRKPSSDDFSSDSDALSSVFFL